MRLVAASVVLLTGVSGYASAQTSVSALSTAKCPYGEYNQDTASVGATGVSEHRKGTCMAKPEPAVEEKEPQPPPNGQYDYEKIVMDEYGLTRRQARDWFEKGADRIEMSIQPMTHGPGTKEYEVLQTIKKLVHSNTLRDVLTIIGTSEKEPLCIQFQDA